MLEDDLIAVATEAAHAAGKLLLGYFRRPARGVETKSTPTDLVSDADRNSESLLLEFIADRRPGDGVLAEEGGGEPSETGLTWVVDPLDGTVNFLYGLADWSVSLAVEDEQGALVGVVHDPITSETFAAIREHGAALNGEAIGLGDCADLERALIGTGFAYDARTREVQARVVANLLPRVRDIRRPGSAALGLCALACGRLDGFYESYLEPWDRAAGSLIVTEAGGLVSDLHAPFAPKVGVVAANRALHAGLRSMVE